MPQATAFAVWQEFSAHTCVSSREVCSWGQAVKKYFNQIVHFVEREYKENKISNKSDKKYTLIWFMVSKSLIYCKTKWFYLYINEQNGPFFILWHIYAVEKGSFRSTCSENTQC